LRRTMENYSSNCRFVMSCNYSSKIIDPIQSRCVILRFKLLEKKDVEKRVRLIAEKENLEIDDGAIETLYEDSEGDCRRVINLLQASAAVANNITSDLVNTLSSTAKPTDVKVVLEYALSGDFLKAKEKLLDVMLRDSVSGSDIIKSIQKEIWNLQIDPVVKVKLTEKTGEIEFRLVEGSDEFIQLESLLAGFVMAGRGD
jgi:replication factor C small subunit